MRESGRKYQRRRSNLNEFGEWLYDLLDYLGVDTSTAAAKAGIAKSTLEKSAKKGRVPARETLERLETALKEIAQEKRYYWPASDIEQPLYNAASHATSGQIRKADQARRDILAEMIRRRDSLEKK